MLALFSIVCDARAHHHRHHHRHEHVKPVEEIDPGFTLEEIDPEFSVSNGRGDQIAQKAISKIGCRYVYGAAGPNTFDCSGLSQWCHKQVGISIPRTASAQAGAGKAVSSPAAGDVVWFNFGSGVAHVGVMVNGREMVHAPNSSKPVQRVSVASGYWAGVKHGYRRFW